MTTLANASAYNQAAAAVDHAYKSTVSASAAAACATKVKPCPWNATSYTSTCDKVVQYTFPTNATYCFYQSWPEWEPFATAVRAMEAAGNATLAPATGVNWWTNPAVATAGEGPAPITSLQSFTLARPFFLPNVCYNEADAMVFSQELNAECMKQKSVVYCNVGIQFYPDPPAALAARAPAATVSTLAGNGTQGSVDGPLANAQLSQPWGVAASAAGDEVYFIDFGGARYQNATRCDAAGYHCSDTPLDPACLSAPGRGYHGIDNCDCGCDVFYMMSSGHRVRKATASAVLTVAGSGDRGTRDGPAATSMFNHPYAVVADGADGDLLVADALSHAVRRYEAATHSVATLVGSSARGCADAAPATSAGLNYPTGLAIGGGGRVVYIADRGNNCVRAFDRAADAVTTVTGGCCTGEWGHRDGAPAAALFSGPTSLALAERADGSVLYVTDAANGVVRAIFLDGGGAALRVDSVVPALGGAAPMPTGVAVGGANELYVSTHLGNQACRERARAQSRTMHQHAPVPPSSPRRCCGTAASVATRRAPPPSRLLPARATSALATATPPPPPLRRPTASRTRLDASSWQTRRGGAPPPDRERSA
jgi:DNA-binding beta-propeller fold protein YncE